jgi:hypothetical protein
MMCYQFRDWPDSEPTTLAEAVFVNPTGVLIENFKRLGH